MASTSIKEHKLRMEQAKSREEFKSRLVMSHWEKAEELDAILRVEMLLHFSPTLSTRQVFSRAVTNLTMACRPCRPGGALR